MSTPTRRPSHRPVSELFGRAAAAGTPTRTVINESGIFALGLVAGMAIMFTIAMGWYVATDTPAEVTCVAVSNVSDPVCGEITNR